MLFRFYVKCPWIKFHKVQPQDHMLAWVKLWVQNTYEVFTNTAPYTKCIPKNRKFKTSEGIFLLPISNAYIYICLLPPCPILWFTYDSNNKKGKFITLGQWKREVIKKSDKPGSFFGYKLLVPHKAIQSGICMYVLYTSKVAEPNRVPTMHSRLCFGSEMCHIFQKRLAAILK